MCSGRWACSTTSNSVLVPAAPAAVWAVLTDPALTGPACSAWPSSRPSRSEPRSVSMGQADPARWTHPRARPGRAAHPLPAGTVCPDLIRAGLDEHDPTCWVTWTTEVVSKARRDPSRADRGSVRPGRRDVQRLEEALQGLARVLRGHSVRLAHAGLWSVVLAPSRRRATRRTKGRGAVGDTRRTTRSATTSVHSSAEERALRGRAKVSTTRVVRDSAQLEVELDRAWDLLRQREGARDRGVDPDSVHERPAGEVESYLQ